MMVKGWRPKQCLFAFLRIQTFDSFINQFPNLPYLCWYNWPGGGKHSLSTFLYNSTTVRSLGENFNLLLSVCVVDAHGRVRQNITP